MPSNKTWKTCSGRASKLRERREGSEGRHRLPEGRHGAPKEGVPGDAAELPGAGARLEALRHESESKRDWFARRDAEQAEEEAWRRRVDADVAQLRSDRDELRRQNPGCSRPFEGWPGRWRGDVVARAQVQAHAAASAASCGRAHLERELSLVRLRCRFNQEAPSRTSRRVTLMRRSLLRDRRSYSSRASSPARCRRPRRA